MGRGKHFQARTLERVDALAFEGAELLAACHEDTLVRLHPDAAAARGRGRAAAGDAAAAAGHVLPLAARGNATLGKQSAAPSLLVNPIAITPAARDRASRLRRARVAQARHRREAGAGSALGPAAGAPSRRADQWLPAVAHGRARMEAGRDARGDLPRLHDAARAQGAAARDRLRREPSSIPGWRAECSRASRTSSSLRCSSPSATRSGGGSCRKPARLERNREALADPVADRGDHGHRFPFDGFRFALSGAGRSGIAHERSFAFVGERDRRSLSGLSPDQLAAGYQRVATGSRC